MPCQRLLPMLAVGLVCACLAIGISMQAATAQSTRADDPFRDLDLESLKKNGKGEATERKPPTEEQATPATQAAPVQEEMRQVFSNENVHPVHNRPTRATTFTLERPTWIAGIGTYHWNNGRGTRAPGTLAVRSSTGETYGPWQAVGAPGQGGVPNAYWFARVDAVLPPGSYTVVDSDPSSWAHNAGSGGAGFAGVTGRVQ